MFQPLILEHPGSDLDPLCSSAQTCRSTLEKPRDTWGMKAAICSVATQRLWGIHPTPHKSSQCTGILPGSRCSARSGFCPPKAETQNMHQREAEQKYLETDHSPDITASQINLGRSSSPPILVTWLDAVVRKLFTPHTSISQSMPQNGGRGLKSFWVQSPAAQGADFQVHWNSLAAAE